MTDSGWTRATRAHPCPVCGAEKWCSVAADESVAICMWTKSPRPTKNGGWLHKLRDDGWRPPAAPRRVVTAPAPKLSPAALAATADRIIADTPLAWLQGEAAALGLDPEAGGAALRKLGAGLHVEYGKPWLAFPMRDALGAALGIRLRGLGDARKLAVRGGKEALFFDLSGVVGCDTLMIVEGPTDATAALVLDLPRLAVVGRPSCTGAVEHVASLVQRAAPRTVLVLPDRDDAGIAGARALAARLAAVHREVRLLTPPIGAKDLRQIVTTQGADAARDWLGSILDQLDRLHARGAEAAR